MFKSIENLSWEDIAQMIVGKSVPEQLSTGTTIAGAGLAGYGLIAGDREAIIDGVVVGGIGMGARAVGVGYRVYKAFWGTPTTGEPVKTLDVSKGAAEDQLGFVEAAKTDNPQRALIMGACKELYGMDIAAFVQLEAKAKENRLNKPECKLWNGAVKFAEMQCSHV
jgi:hypothetical protein